jgi:hypothetical protein
MIEPCRNCGSDTHHDAPSAGESVTMIAQACDHGISEWTAIKDILGIDKVSMAHAMASMTSAYREYVHENEKEPHCTWQLLFFENGTLDNLFCAVETRPTGHTLYWDPCTMTPLHFHSHVPLSEWALSEFMRQGGDLGSVTAYVVEFD